MILAAAAHNFEEWLGRIRLLELENELARRLGLAMAHPPVEQFEVALVIATVVPAVVLGICGLGPLTRAKAVGIAFVSSLFLTNVLLPHAILTAAAGGYTPGLATAVLINLPLGIAILRSIAGDRTIGRGALTAIVAGSLVALPLTVSAAYSAARLLG